jgi:hypothetical protein
LDTRAFNILKKNFRETSIFFTEPPPDWEACFLWASTRSPEAPLLAFQALGIELLAPQPLQWPEFLKKVPLPPEFFPLALDTYHKRCWGYIVDDPSEKGPYQLASYSFLEYHGYALPTPNLIDALLEWTNDLIEDREESRSFQEVEVFYEFAEILLTLYQKQPLSWKRQGFWSRQQRINTLTEDGLGCIFPPRLKNLAFLASVPSSFQNLQTAFACHQWAEALYHGRNLWRTIHQRPFEEAEEVKNVLVQTYYALERPLLALRLIHLSQLLFPSSS